ncbi:hypothetical protein J2S43_007853 [Catenuloplanes nepalensis]|uniref:Minor tail protein n=1 Tax=Catenuloplanes nepalensis TaxID=587533 RepID=A0ABT9N7W2_9ACTN|nr:hypothetical protein [Catenuloplanes nepalensis]MDP9799341.1 hypothetical protein [Catenuloplanes nepalensis]
MPSVPVARVWLDEDGLNVTNLNAYISDVLTFLLNKPAGRLRQATAQPLSTATWTSITMTAEDLDDDPIGSSAHSNSANTSRWTAAYPGWYRVGGAVAFAGNTAGQRGARWAVNGTPLDGSEVIIPAAVSGVLAVPARSMLVPLGVGSYLELQGWHTAGTTLSTYATTTGQSSMDISWDRMPA